jgi:hypothetical protein
MPGRDQGRVFKHQSVRQKRYGELLASATEYGHNAGAQPRSEPWPTPKCPAFRQKGMVPSARNRPACCFGTFLAKTSMVTSYRHRSMGLCDCRGIQFASLQETVTQITAWLAANALELAQAKYRNGETQNIQ